MTSFAVNLPFNICVGLLIVNFVLFLQVPYYMHRISQLQGLELYNEKYDDYTSRIVDITSWLQGSFILSVCLFLFDFMILQK